MQHSVLYIAEKYEEISSLRGDVYPFVAEDFINFAKSNRDKYSLIDISDDMLVSTWHSADLISDYKKSLIPKEWEHDNGY